MNNARTTRYFRLSDGRTLSYSDTGTGENGTWVHCHGIPGSRYELLHLESDLVRAGVRVIVPDRPGYGLSTPHPGYQFSNHSEDLKQLADYLGLQIFRLSGFSGGGVFALAAAHNLESRVECLSIAATPAVPLMETPFEHASELTANTWQAALENPTALAVELKALTGSAGVLSEALLDAAGMHERQYLSSVLVAPGFLASINAALEQGPEMAAEALARDTFLIADSWPFQPEDLSIPVRVIHGAEDELVHKEHQAALSRQLPDSQARVVSGGHYSALSLIWE